MQWLKCKKRSRGTLTSHFLPSPFLPSPPLLCREAVPENQRCQLPQWGPRRSPCCKRISLYFELENRTRRQHFWLFYLSLKWSILKHKTAESVRSASTVCRHSQSGRTSFRRIPAPSQHCMHALNNDSQRFCLYRPTRLGDRNRTLTRNENKNRNILLLLLLLSLLFFFNTLGSKDPEG